MSTSYLYFTHTEISDEAALEFFINITLSAFLE